MALGSDEVAVGTWTHPEGHTGCTVVLPPPGTVGGIAVRGAAPGTREAAALGPAGAVTSCDAVLLSGGSAFGLAAADGVMGWLEERGRGHPTPTAAVPIVGAAIVFDLLEQPGARPDAASGRAACAAATTAEPTSGPVGVGAGCSVGKTAGLTWRSPAGQGAAVERDGAVTVGALVAVNALGDVTDAHGRVLAGSQAPSDHPRFPSAPLEALVEDGPGPGQHTVIGCVVTDAALDKAQACRVADLAHTGVARAVDPAHTSLDGDALFCLATGSGTSQRPPSGAAPVDLVAHLAARAVATAVRAAVVRS